MRLLKHKSTPTTVTLRSACSVLENWFKGDYSRKSLEGRDIEDIKNSCRFLKSYSNMEPVVSTSLHRTHRIGVTDEDITKFGNVRNLVQDLDSRARAGTLSFRTEKIVSFSQFSISAAIFAVHNSTDGLLDDTATLNLGRMVVISEAPTEQFEILLSMKGLVNTLRENGIFGKSHTWKSLATLRALRFSIVTRKLKSSFWDFAWANEVICEAKDQVFRPIAVRSVTKEYSYFHPTRLFSLDPRIKINT